MLFVSDLSKAREVNLQLMIVTKNHSSQVKVACLPGIYRAISFYQNLVGHDIMRLAKSD
jgi:hypothetical protein